MNRITIKPSQPSIYGRMRAEPRREYVSTLESVAVALTLCGESPEIEAGLSNLQDGAAGAGCGDHSGQGAEEARSAASEAPK